MIQKITPFLWFDTQAEEAAKYYVSIFEKSKICQITYAADKNDIKKSKVLTVDFVLQGQNFIALNGGPYFKFNESISFSIECENQAEVDFYWSTLSAEGEPGQCGWLKDKYGVSWQVNPMILAKLLNRKDAVKAQKVMTAMRKMGKIEIQKLLDAAT
jgi:predicted 3-demethylubiquinone-9 3-methyltransferase (glyoxalase superfamily)